MIPMGLVRQMHRVKFLLNENSTTILTAVGVSGTVATSYLTGRASFKAADLIAEQVEIINTEVEDMEIDPVYLTRRDKFKLIWRLYVPPIGVGVLTIASIIMANKISAKRIAALTVASGISERALKEYKEKVVEKFGKNKERDVHDEIAQDRVNKNPVNSREVILAGTGEVLCFDMTTGRYFQSTIEEIKRAENKINFQLVNFMMSSLSEFYDEIGLPPTSYSDQVGWNTDNRMELVFSTTLSTDGRPCITVDFVNQPIPNYDRIYGD